MTSPDTPPRGPVVELDEATCRERLATATVARVVHVVEDEPHVSLVNAALDGDAIVVRSLPGTRLATALNRPGAPVLVEADEVDPATRSGWSVVARGRMEPVLDTVEVARLDRAMPPWTSSPAARSVATPPRTPTGPDGPRGSVVLLASPLVGEVGGRLGPP